ncbi:pyrimidine deaminase RibD-like protein [Asticcacaulis solisilvae]|nr:pyrimidine deaminase RibD-like protein [Asticcacaulis solisilvae]MDR6800686.1 pyrimidine deaminase RibD-like protein [Asticcacaulis sp. BE141]
MRNRQLDGRKFVRQLGIGPYFADFACRDSALVVELDGNQHIDSHYDDLRNQYMNELGWSVARFSTGGALEPVLETIAAICDGEIREFVRAPEFQFYPAVTGRFAPHPNPLPASGERGLQDGERGYLNGEREFMRQAIVLARPGKTWPNPAVGCVIVKNGIVIAEGATGDGGRPHAEEVALAAAGKKAGGATAYVTLEPCGERSTGVCSCSQRLVDAKVARVVYACVDPSPYASHKGPQRLKDAGIVVEQGLGEKEAAHLIAPFAHWLKTGQPLVKIAETPDGFDAEFTGNPEDLKDWAAKGYRHLFVRPGSPQAQALVDAGLIDSTAKY